MKRAFAIGLAIAALTTAAIGQSPQDSRGPAGSETRGPEQARKTIDTYCVGCHNSRARVAGLALDTLSLDAGPSTPMSGKKPCASCAAA